MSTEVHIKPGSNVSGSASLGARKTDLECGTIIHLSAGMSKESRRNNRSARTNTFRTSRYGDEAAFWSESLLERKVGLCFAADRNVKEVLGQPPAVRYRDLNGKLRKHTFDFLITMHDGTRKFIFVKPMKSVVKHRYDIVVKLIASQLTRRQADAVLIMTEQDVSDVKVDTAELFLQALREPACRDIEAILDVLREASGPMSIADVVAAIDDKRLGYWRTIYAMHQGQVGFDRLQRVNINTRVWLEAQAA